MHLVHPAALLAVLALALAGAGCDERAQASPADAAPPLPAPPSPAPVPVPSVRAAPSASGSASVEKGELRVLKAVFTSEVKNKDPIDDLKSAKPGQRVWAHLTVRNRGDGARTLTLVFKVNGSERSTVALPVEPSWSFRTWGYNTLRKGDSGKLELEVKDESGAILVQRAIPIRIEGDPPGPIKPEPLDE